MGKIIDDLDFGLTDEQKRKLSAALEKLIAVNQRNAGRSDLGGGFKPSWYATGVADGLNHAYKLVNGIDDDYNYKDK